MSDYDMDGHPLHEVAEAIVDFAEIVAKSRGRLEGAAFEANERLRAIIAVNGVRFAEEYNRRLACAHCSVSLLDVPRNRPICTDCRDSGHDPVRDECDACGPLDEEG